MTESGVRTGRGRLKIYLGPAAGVGKTYSMLSDGRAEFSRGVDVVVGYVEAHGRSETEELLEGLEQLPLQTVVHRGVTLREFALDAALARRPSLLLVDELAHTNVPGSRHAKRWQDIDELLDCGIDVCTTVNIQHVESLRDLVARITGVYVKETVPDAFFDKADDVELVDLPPQELHQRLRDGKVYIQEKVEQAISGFFKRDNLLALRELALRHTAEPVDEEIRRAREQRSSAAGRHTRERVMACVAPNRMAPRIVREARRFSASLHADWFAVNVDTSQSAAFSQKDRRFLDYAMNLAESLGAEIANLSGEDVVEEVIRFARERDVTTILVGKPVRPRWRELITGSFVDAIIRASGDIDVLVITGAEEQGAPLIVRRPPQKAAWKAYVFAPAVVAACTGIGYLMVDRFDLANIVMVYLLGVVVTSALSKHQAWIVTVLGVAAFDFCFVHPRGTLAVQDAQYIVTFTIMLGVSLLISSLTQRLKEQSEASSRRERNTAALYDLSRELASLRDQKEIAEAAVAKVAARLHTEAALLIPEGPNSMKPIVASGSGFESDPHEIGVSRWVFDNGRVAGQSTDTLSGARGLHLPLIGSAGPLGTIVIDLNDGQAIETPKRHFVDAVASQLAGALERARYAEESNRAALRVETEQMRSDLLSAVSHDLRTPLTAIQGAAGILTEQPGLDRKGKELALTVLDQSERMARLVQNLLDMTRVQGSVELQLDWYGLEELVANAVARTEPMFRCRVKVVEEGDPIVVKVDGVLIEQVIVNLLENCARHAGPDVNVEIHVRQEGGNAVVEVIDDGPGIPADEREKVFERFYHKGESGFGLGLAICKAALEAHSGRAFALGNSPHGLVIRLEIPASVGDSNE